MMDIPAMNLWDTILEKLHTQQRRLQTCSVHQKQILKHQELFGDIDHVPPHVRLFSV